jgi:signal transduction histidine kinase
MNAELESLVAERTRELAEANESLQVENEEHIKTAERLRIINAELDTFVYRASHDLKGPLASLIGLINIAGMELQENAVASRYLGLMDKASKRLDGILFDLIDATQVKQRKVEYIKVNALAFTKALLEVMRNNIDFSKVELTLDIDPDLELVTDETLITSILQNYIANAIRYRDPAKEIAMVTISIKGIEDKFTISVADNGVGIPDKARSQVFEMFYKGSTNNTGSGLGLYIVKQATEKLGGTVSLDTHVGQGTTMFAHIPQGNA